MAQAILLQDVETLGERGDVVDVSPGYLRNYLVPRKLAQPATPAAIADAERRKEAAERAVARGRREGRGERRRCCARPCSRSRTRRGDDGRLFGSVTSQDIVDAIKQARGLQARQAPRPARRADQDHGHAHGHRRGRRRRDGATSRPSSPRALTAQPLWLSPSRREASGSVPPHNVEAETSVLGAILLTEQALDGVLLEVGLRPDDFYRPRHRLIFQAMIRLKEKADPGGRSTRSRSARSSRRAGELEEAGGEAYVHSLPDVVPAVGDVLHYARIVKEHALLRRVLEATREIQDEVARHQRRAARADRAGRAGALPDRPRRRHARDALDRGGPPRRDRQARGALARGTSGSPARRPASRDLDDAHRRLPAAAT